MANIKSARKRARQSIKRRAHNMSLRTAVRTAIKSTKKAIASGDREAAAAALRGSQGAIDRVSSKRVMHRNAANRYKSRLARALKAMQ